MMKSNYYDKYILEKNGGNDYRNIYGNNYYQYDFEVKKKFFLEIEKDVL